ncbi:conserved hypothetical protein [Tenacibaculum sp. 190524A05c]
MKNSYDQLTTEFIETRKVSPLTICFSIVFALIFAFIPLAELVKDFEYNQIKYEPKFTCIIGNFEPLQFKEYKPLK